MICLHPLTIANPKCDKHGFYTYNKFDDLLYRAKYGKEAYIEVPCGKCEACIDRKSNEWASRIYHEWLSSPTSAFLTLTYAEENLTYKEMSFELGSYIEKLNVPQLEKTDVQKFMKRLRRVLGNGVRFFIGGEYGETDGRPHYHLALFHFDVRYNDIIYDIVKEVWKLGNVTYGDMNIQRVMYVAKYIYSSSMVDDDTVKNFQKPFILSSRRPGIGYQYFLDRENRKYHNDTLDTSIPIDDGKKMPMPRYYRDKIFTKESKEILYHEWIENPVKKPSKSEVNLFLKRFKKKKRGKSI